MTHPPLFLRLALAWRAVGLFCLTVPVEACIEIAYPAAGERIQPGETCSLVVTPLNGRLRNVGSLEYAVTDPKGQRRAFQPSPKTKLVGISPPLQEPGIHLLEVRAVDRAGAVVRKSVSIRVESGQYDWWPDYHYPDLNEVEKFAPDPWVPEDHTKAGWDWSLPGFVTPSPRSALAIERKFNMKARFRKPQFGFPVNPAGSLWVRWKELEPNEGEIDLSLLEETVRDATDKGLKIELRLLFCNQGRIGGRDAEGRPILDSSLGFAPDWLAGKGIKRIHYPNGRVDYDPLDPVFHFHYQRLVRAIGNSTLPDLVSHAYAGYASESNGDEGIGPEVGAGEDPAALYPIVKERLDAWAGAFRNHPHKVYMGGPSQYGFDLGFGVRRGFVEKYLYEIPDRTLGSYLGPEGYLEIDESRPLHALGLVNGEENEEYEEKWARASTKHRFGYTTATFPYRYFVSSLRMLQMRCDFALTGTGHLIEGMLPFLSLEMGRTVEDSPDVWAYLNTGYINQGLYEKFEYREPPRPRSEREANTGIFECRNFERWLHQRDAPGFETEPRIKVNQPHQMWMTPPARPYDHIARGGRRIGFHIDDRWMEQHREGTLAVKVTFIDSEEVRQRAADGTLQLRYQSHGEEVVSPVKLVGNDTLRTSTFFLDGLEGNQLEHGYDFTVEAGGGADEVVVSMVRVIRADDPGVRIAGPLDDDVPPIGTAARAAGAGGILPWLLLGTALLLTATAITKLKSRARRRQTSFTS